MLPIASATRTAKFTADWKGVAKEVAFKSEVADTVTVSDEDMPTTVIRCSDLQPGQRITGTSSRCRRGRGWGPSATEKRMYLMPWGEALIGVDPGTRRRLAYSVFMAWEHDHSFVRYMCYNRSLETLLGSIGRHPLSPPQSMLVV